MIRNGKKERAALDRLADLLVDDILSMPDEDILAEYRETHGDPANNAAVMQTLFEKSVLISNKKRLAAAKAGAAENRRSPIATIATPVDISVARARLRGIIDTASTPQRFTLAARKENELSDADVLGMLDDLRELGILPSDDG
jgi:hypothetical protein